MPKRQEIPKMTLYLLYLLKWSPKKSAPTVFFVALKKSNLNTLILTECVTFFTFLGVKDREFQKWPQNYCIFHSLQSGANFPEIAIGYGSPGMIGMIPDLHSLLKQPGPKLPLTPSNNALKKPVTI